MLSGNLSNLVAEISFDLQHEPANPFGRLIRFECDELLGKWTHTACCFSRSNCPEHSDAGKQSFFWNRQPLRVAGGSDSCRVMNLSDDKEQIVPEFWIGIQRKGIPLLFPLPGKTQYVNPREGSGVNEERRAEQEQRVAPPKYRVNERVSEGYILQVQVALGKWIHSEQNQPGHAGKNQAHKCSRIGDSLQHGNSPFRGNRWKTLV